MAKLQLEIIVLIMAYAHIAHDCKVGNNCIIVNSVAMGGHVKVGDHAIIGGLSALHQFVSVGKHAMVSGGSLVRKDVPPYVKAAREPLSFVGINSIGLRRRGFTDEKIKHIQDIFRILYQNNYNNTQAILNIETEIIASEERDEIISFIQNSGRGIMKGYNQKIKLWQQQQNLEMVFVYNIMESLGRLNLFNMLSQERALHL